MKSFTEARRLLPALVLLVATLAAGCGGGLEDSVITAPGHQNDTVGAPLGDPYPAAPGMHLPAPVHRSTALAASPEPAANDAVASVWVRDDNAPEPAPVGELTPAGASASDDGPSIWSAPDLQPAAPAQPAAGTEVALT